MLEVAASIAPRPGTQAKIIFGREVVPWSPAELALLRSIARGRVTEAMLVKGLPGRTVRASRKQLCKVREAMGVETEKTMPERMEQRNSMLDPDDDGMDDGEMNVRRSRAASANAAFLEALQRSLAA